MHFLVDLFANIHARKELALLLLSGVVRQRCAHAIDQVSIQKLESAELGSVVEFVVQSEHNVLADQVVALKLALLLDCEQGLLRVRAVQLAVRSLQVLRVKFEQVLLAMGKESFL